MVTASVLLQQAMIWCCSMGAIEDHEAYLKAKNDPDIMNSPEVKNPSSIKPGKLGKSGLHYTRITPKANWHEVCNSADGSIPFHTVQPLGINVTVFCGRLFSRSWSCLAERFQSRVCSTSLFPSSTDSEYPCSGSSVLGSSKQLGMAGNAHQQALRPSLQDYISDHDAGATSMQTWRIKAPSIGTMLKGTKREPHPDP